MNQRNITRRLTLPLLLTALLVPCAPTTDAARVAATDARVAVFPALAAQSSAIGVNGFFSVDPAQQGSTFQAAIVLDITDGIHVNSNRPLGKYAIPTSVKVSAQKWLKVTTVTYHQGTLLKLSLSHA